MAKLKPNANAAHRREVLRVLREVLKMIRWLITRWAARGTVFAFDEPRTAAGNVVVRDRRFGEYPENQSAEWATLSEAIGKMIFALESLRSYARAARDLTAAREWEEEQQVRTWWARHGLFELTSITADDILSARDADHAEAVDHEARAICASIPIDGRPAEVTAMLEAAELLTDEHEHRAAVRAAREKYDEFASYSQLRSWVERHGLQSGRPEHVRPAIELDHAEALTV